MLAGTLTLAGGSAEEWDTFTGRHRPYPFVRRGGKLEASFSLPPAGSLLLCVRDGRAVAPAVPPVPAWDEVRAEGELAVEALGPKVLTLDYCDLTAAGRTERDLYFYDAQRKAFQAHGIDRNPWDSAVQYKTNIIDRDRFPAGSGFEAVFWFRTVKGDAADFADLKAVVERPDAELYHERRSQTDEHTGKPVPDAICFDYQDGDTRYAMSYLRQKTLVSQKMLDFAKGWQKTVGEIIRYPGGYLRFEALVTLDCYKEGQVVEHYEAEGVFEQMYFGRHIDFGQ